MNFYLRRCLVALTIFILAHYTVSAEKYSLNEYLALVEKNNKDLRITRLNTGIARQKISQAASALLPMIAVNAGYDRNLTNIEEPVAAYSYDDGSGSGIYPVAYVDSDKNYDNEVQFALGATFEVYNPASYGNLRLTEKNYSIQGMVEAFTLETILKNAKVLYAQVQLLNGVAEGAKESEESSEDVYNNQVKRFNAGTISELDLRMAEVDWKNKIAIYAESKKNAAVALAALRAYAGIPYSKDITVSSDDEEALPPIPEKRRVSEVLPHRKDYTIAILAKEAADLSYSNALTAFLPTVSTSFSLAYGQYGGMKNADDWNAYSYKAAILGVKISLPVFTGFYRTSAIEEAELQQRKALEEISQKYDQIEQENENLYLSLQEASSRIESAKTLLDAAERASALSVTALENGLGTQLSVSQASVNLSFAKVSLQQAFFDFKCAYYEWQAVTGGCK